MLSALYRHHVDVLHVHGRVIVVAGEREIVSSASAPDALADRARVLLLQPRFSWQLGIGAVVAIVAACTGVFTVIRGQAFAGEALGDIGAAGGSSAYLAGIGPVWGFLVSSLTRRRR